MLSTSYAYCHVPVAPLRADHSHRSEQVSQLLYGEKVHLLSPAQNGWVYVACEWDQYCGWVKESQLTSIDKKQYIKAPKFYTGQHDAKLLLTQGKITLALGSSLLLYKAGAVPFSTEETAKFKGKKLNLKNIMASPALVQQWALAYYGAPYVWGGRTHLGIDCSGLSQMVYKIMNIPIARDASQQADQGVHVDFLLAAQCGDLAFFDNEEGKIIHVGILLDNSTIIHATESSGGVVIDRIDAQGIISNKLKIRTHQLRLIKRFL